MDEENLKLRNVIESLCASLTLVHNDMMSVQGVAAENVMGLDWPRFTHTANSIRDAEKLLGKKLAKTDIWTLFPESK